MVVQRPRCTGVPNSQRVCPVITTIFNAGQAISTNWRYRFCAIVEGKNVTKYSKHGFPLENHRSSLTRYDYYYWPPPPHVRSSRTRRFCFATIQCSGYNYFFVFLKHKNVFPHTLHEKLTLGRRNAFLIYEHIVNVSKSLVGLWE